MIYSLHMFLIIPVWACCDSNHKPSLNLSLVNLCLCMLQVIQVLCTACPVMTVMLWLRVCREQGYWLCRIMQASVTATENMCRPSGSIRTAAR